MEISGFRRVDRGTEEIELCLTREQVEALKVLIEAEILRRMPAGLLEPVVELSRDELTQLRRALNGARPDTGR